ncbi:MAG: GDP-mannose 4,6-dehydratase [Acidimicrobiales bacterium]
MKALITGAGGFVGHHLAAHLDDAGDDVATTDRRQGGPDIVDSAAMQAVVESANPDVIYHLAGQADVAASWRDPVDTFKSNALGTVSVLRAASMCDVARIVVVSSAEVYGLAPPDAMPLAESAPIDPVTPYAASKAAAEMSARQWANSGLGAVIARPFNHLGPGQSDRFVAPALASRLIQAKAEGRDHIPIGNTAARRDFVDVRDVVRAYRLLAVAGSSGEVYNICSGTDVAISELAQMILDRVDPTIRLEPDPDLQRPSDLPVLRGDPSKIQSLGWHREISLENTVDDLIASIPLVTAK